MAVEPELQGRERPRWLPALLLAVAFTTLTLCVEPELRPFLPVAVAKLIGHSRQSTSALGSVIEFVFSVLIYWVAFWLVIGVARRRRSSA